LYLTQARATPTDPNPLRSGASDVSNLYIPPSLVIPLVLLNPRALASAERYFFGHYAVRTPCPNIPQSLSVSFKKVVVMLIPSGEESHQA
jgi:hypothetical protein